MAIKILKTTPDWLILTADFPTMSVPGLYAHWTTPDLLNTWWVPDVRKMDPTIGEDYHLAWTAMDWHLRGTIKAATPNTVFAFSWAWDHEPSLPSREVCISFRAHEGGSALTLLHGIYGDSDAEQKDRQNHIDGWQHFLGELANTAT